MKIAVCAGEKSGDALGHELIVDLKENIENLEIIGVGGPLMESEGLKSFFPIKEISYMGLIDPLINLPKILSIRKKLLNLFLLNEIDIFIGVDSPDFNMFFHKKLKHNNIRTIQVVSPSVWGWRENRIHAIQAYVDLTMCLFKFECNFYDQKNMHSFFLGHPFSQLKPKKNEEIISKYDLDGSKDFISILPGSRESEISQLMPVYIEAAKKLLQSNLNAYFLIPAANKKLAEKIQSMQGLDDLPYELVINSSQDFLSLSPVSIVTSGTASLEAAVLGSVPIICYKTNMLNYAILSKLVKTPFIGLPNLLLQEHIFPELIQNDLTPDSIVQSFSKILSEPEKYQSHLSKMNNSMQGKGFDAAAAAVGSLL